MNQGIENPLAQAETSCKKPQRAAPSSSQLLRTTYTHRVFQPDNAREKWLFAGYL